MSNARQLQAALSGNAGKDRLSRHEAPGLAPASDEAVATVPRPQPATGRPASREGKVNISGWFDPAYKRSLRMIQAATDKKLEPLLAEALNELFAKYDVPQVRED